jgi:hypothetical protein
MGTRKGSENRKALIVELQEIARTEPTGLVTRRVYRERAKRPSAWQSYFDSFKEFTITAGVNLTPNASGTPTETNEVVGNTWTVTMPKTRISTLEGLLANCKADLSIWEVERFTAKAWEMGYKDSDDKGAHYPLYAVSATFKKRVAIVEAKKIIEELKEEAKSFARAPSPVIYDQTGSGNLLEIMIPDLHAGKLCWSSETGYQDYNTKIAVETYRKALDSLLELASGYKFDRILLGVGNDLLHTDNVQGTTYSGTKVDTDTRYHKTYRVVRKMLSESIEKLRLIAPVTVKLVPGNHDTLSVFTLGDSLECTFDKYPDVDVDNGPSLHKTFEWGDVFLLLTHGHEGKQADYGVWMASKYPKEFGRTKYREIHVGHKHKTSLDEKFGIRVRTLSSLTEPDAWHAENNFTGNLRTAEALVFNKKQGLIAQFYFNAD